MSHHYSHPYFRYIFTQGYLCEWNLHYIWLDLDLYVNDLDISDDWNI